jgi:hypothetical protein
MNADWSRGLFTEEIAEVAKEKRVIGSSGDRENRAYH